MYEERAQGATAAGVVTLEEGRVVGTSERARSRMALEYSDLKVEILDRRDHAKTRRFLTEVADKVLIKTDNPGRNGRMREEEGEHERDPEKSMWNYFWHTMWPAIRKTVI